MLDLIATRIMGAPGCQILTIGTGLDLAAALKAPPAKMPAAYIWPVAATGAPNTMINTHRQVITEAVGVTLALRRHGDALGARKVADLDQLSRWLRALLVGWQPDETHEPLSFDRAGLDAMVDGVVWWTEQFTTTHTHVGAP